MIDWPDDAISKWAERFRHERRDATELWKDVEILAARYRNAVHRGADDANIQWHHLVLAIGNFKRQSPIQIGPLRLTESGSAELEEIKVPETGVSVKRCGPWEGLLTKGIRTATATAILAALWPSEHMILDEWVLHIGNAILVEEADRWTDWLDRTDSPFPEATPEAYNEMLPFFRNISVDHGTRQLQDLERASFILSQRLGTAAGRTWGSYIQDLNDLLRTGP